MEFTYEFRCDQAERSLQRLDELLSDQSPAWTRIREDYRQMVTEQFASEGRAGGTPWAELAPSTLRRRRGGARILNVTGTLLSSLRDVGAPGHVERADEQTLTLGSRLAYALYHQTGTGSSFGQGQRLSGATRARGMPARPLLVLTESRTEQWVEIVRRHLEGKTSLLGPRELG